MGGFLTIHTQPFSTKGENFLVILARKIENKILKNLSFKTNTFQRFDRLKSINAYEEIIQREDGKIL